MTSHEPETRAPYVKIYAALMTLMLLNVGSVFIPMGWGNALVTFSIALAEATLVVMFLMHVKYNNKLIWIYAVFGFLWFIAMVWGMLSDVLTRP